MQDFEAAEVGPVGPLLERSVMRPLAPLEPVAALYVEPSGVYVGVPGVDPWDEARDARKYSGPHPVVCHSPCQRWGKFWHGSTRKPHQYRLGEDGGCFAAAQALAHVTRIARFTAGGGARLLFATTRFFGLKTGRARGKRTSSIRALTHHPPGTHQSCHAHDRQPQRPHRNDVHTKPFQLGHGCRHPHQSDHRLLRRRLKATSTKRYRRHIH